MIFSTVAIQALKRKKRFENELRKLDGTLSTIEMQRETLEDANTNTAVLANMKSAADALKIAHQNLYDLFFIINVHSSVLLNKMFFTEIRIKFMTLWMKFLNNKICLVKYRKQFQHQLEVRSKQIIKSLEITFSN